jgi:hypothetical protein
LSEALRPRQKDRFVIALPSEEIRRYFVSQIGQVQEVLDIHGTSMRRCWPIMDRRNATAVT